MAKILSPKHLELLNEAISHKTDLDTTSSNLKQILIENGKTILPNQNAHLSLLTSIFNILPLLDHTNSGFYDKILSKYILIKVFIISGI